MVPAVAELTELGAEVADAASRTSAGSRSPPTRSPRSSTRRGEAAPKRAELTHGEVLAEVRAAIAAFTGRCCGPATRCWCCCRWPTSAPGCSRWPASTPGPRSATCRTPRTWPPTSACSGRARSWPAPTCCATCTRPPGTRPPPRAARRCSTRPSAVAVRFGARGGPRSRCGCSTRSPTRSCTRSCARPSAAAASRRSPPASRSTRAAGAVLPRHRHRRARAAPGGLHGLIVHPMCRSVQRRFPPASARGRGWTRRHIRGEDGAVESGPSREGSRAADRAPQQAGRQGRGRLPGHAALDTAAKTAERHHDDHKSGAATATSHWDGHNAAAFDRRARRMTKALATTATASAKARADRCDHRLVAGHQPQGGRQAGRGVHEPGDPDCSTPPAG